MTTTIVLDELIASAVEDVEAAAKAFAVAVKGRADANEAHRRASDWLRTAEHRVSALRTSRDLVADVATQVTKTLLEEGNTK